MINLDLTGQTFGYLTVEKLAFSKKNKKFWNCVCKCGERIITYTAQLRSGKTKSCGCLHREKIRTCSYGEAAFNKLYNSYKRQAEKRNFKFELNKEQFSIITKSNCYYCDKSPSMCWKEKGQLWGEYIYNGIDRLDSNIGYVIENCVPCCKTHNRMKSDLSLDEFLEACKQVINHLTQK